MKTKVLLSVLVLFAALCLAQNSSPVQGVGKLASRLKKQNIASNGRRYQLSTECLAGWEQINKNPVCFESRGDKPGVVTNLGCGKMVGAIKLVYRSGSIQCDSDKASYASRWGCHNFPNPYITNYPLNVVITDSSKHRIFPLDKSISPGWTKPGLWYYLPFTHPLDSNELVFLSHNDPVYLPQNGMFKVWYGEDLTNFHDTDNKGRVCVDVFIQTS